jgi:uncharacterized RDD family membrane protein YckC
MVDGADEAQVDIRVPASRGRRLGAACIDWLLIGIPGVPLFWSSWNLLDGTSRPLENPFIDLSPLVTFIDKAAIFAVLALLALAIVQAILATRGSSIGKRILGLYVVTEPGRNSRLGFGRGVILRILVPNVVTSATGGLFFLIDQAFIFRDDRRCIHDHIAGTVVLADPRWQDVANDDTGLAPSP